MNDPQKQIDEDHKRLDKLEDEIEEVRHNTPDYKAEHEQHFIDEGARDKDEDVDNTIVPPG